MSGHAGRAIWPSPDTVPGRWRWRISWPWAGCPGGDTDAIATALRATGANALVGRRIDTLAGGDQAPAPTGQPQLLLADGPVASVDLYSQLRMMGTLRSFPLTDMLQLNPFRIICSE